MVKGEASITAKVCAFARAHHARFAKKPVCEDLHAYELLGEQEYEWIRKNIVRILSSQNWQIPELETWDQFIEELITPIIVSRMKYAADELKRFMKGENEPAQYVICGAGLDSFIFANTDPKLQIFELDHPDTQRYKLSRIRKLGWQIPSNVHFVPIDFEVQDMKTVLDQTEFQPDQKTFFSVLGVSYYLPVSVFSAALGQIAGVGVHPQNQIVFDYPEPLKKGGHIEPRMAVLSELAGAAGETMRGGMDKEALRTCLSANGLKLRQHMTPQMIQERYFRESNDQLRAYENVYFVTAENGGLI